MKLPKGKKHLFKEPLGQLFEDFEELSNYLESKEYRKLITVGDCVTCSFLERGYEINKLIVDFKTKRSSITGGKENLIKNYEASSIKVDNPKGRITEELWNAIGCSEEPLKIYVDGEEDLATLPAVILSPRGTVVFYGQPNRGIVLVEVSDDNKREFEEYLNHFDGDKSFV